MKKLTTVLLAFLMMLNFAGAVSAEEDYGITDHVANPFSDVTKDLGNTTYKAILWAYETGIVKGTSDTTYSPTDHCTRAQLCVMLWRLKGKPAVDVTDNPFPDVSAELGNTTYKAILWAYKQGIVKGNPDGTFNPSGDTTRANMAVMLWRTAGKPTVSAEENPFEDVSQSLGNTTYKSILWAYSVGLTKGTDSTHFSPGDACTRAQLAVFLYRLNRLYHYITPEEPSPEPVQVTIDVFLTNNQAYLYHSELDEFAKKHPEYQITFNKTVSSENKSAYREFVENGQKMPDLYLLSYDELELCAKGGFLAKLGNAGKNAVAAQNNPGVAKAAEYNGEMYAIPVQVNNGYLLFYDRSVVSDEHAKDLFSILDDCRNRGTMFGMDVYNGWYLASLFFGAGCVSKWDADNKLVEDTWNSVNGLLAAKAVAKLMNDSAFSSDSIPYSGVSAFISGTWMLEQAKDVYGDNLGMAELPSVTMDGKTFHLGGFTGVNLVGVKPQSDSAKAQVLSELQIYLTSEEVQKKFCEKLSYYGATNKNVIASVQDPSVRALAAQAVYGTPQGAINDTWWDISAGIARSIHNLDGYPTDEELRDILGNYESSIRMLGD